MALCKLPAAMQHVTSHVILINWCLRTFENTLVPVCFKVCELCSYPSKFRSFVCEPELCFGSRRQVFPARVLELMLIASARSQNEDAAKICRTRLSFPVSKTSRQKATTYAVYFQTNHFAWKASLEVNKAVFFLTWCRQAVMFVKQETQRSDVQRLHRV